MARPACSLPVPQEAVSFETLLGGRRVSGVSDLWLPRRLGPWFLIPGWWEEGTGGLCERAGDPLVPLGE